MKLCFLDLNEDADGWVSAASLVTDETTRPLEFRVTDQVHTDEVQRVLYGAAYDEQLYGVCLVAPLLEACREKPDLILVRDGLTQGPVTVDGKSLTEIDSWDPEKVGSEPLKLLASGGP